jgi:FkbM family methyltransferase
MTKRFKYSRSDRRERFDFRIGQLLNFNLDIKTVLHVGAHFAEEAREYSHFNLKVLWIEADPDFVEIIQRKGLPTNQAVRQALLYSKPDVNLNFYAMGSSGAHSSILEPLPTSVGGLTINSKQTLTSTTVDLLGFESDLIVIDVQGAELDVLKGSDLQLENTKYVYLEASKKDIYYSGTSIIRDIDVYMNNHNYVRLISAFHGQNGNEGNILYGNRAKINNLTRLNLSVGGYFINIRIFYRLQRRRIGKFIKKYVRWAIKR